MEVVLVDVGERLPAVAALLKEVMRLTLTDPEALNEATPLVLFESLERNAAEEFRARLRHCGALAEFRTPRQKGVGLKRPSSAPQAAA